MTNELKSIPEDREAGGKVVRGAWIAWALEQPAPKPSRIVPLEELSEPDREADRRIWEACTAPCALSSPRVPAAISRATSIHRAATAIQAIVVLAR